MYLIYVFQKNFDTLFIKVTGRGYKNRTPAKLFLYFFSTSVIFTIVRWVQCVIICFIKTCNFYVFYVRKIMYIVYIVYKYRTGIYMFLFPQYY